MDMPGIIVKNVRLMLMETGMVILPVACVLIRNWIVMTIMQLSTLEHPSCAMG
jgi:hypothetical protein